MIQEVRTTVSVKDLLDAGLHFGHQTKRWNPKMKRFIFGERNGIYIIDLQKTLAALKQAQVFAFDTVLRGRKILFVGTKKQAQEPIRRIAEELNQPYVIHRWLGGTLTNAQTVRKSVKRMIELERISGEGVSEKGVATKKELASLNRELEKLHRNLNGIRDMEDMPGAMFVVDINREGNAVKEAQRLHIPVIAMVDTNCDPEPIDYPVPCNDDAIRAIELVTSMLAETISKASEEYTRVAAEQARKREEAAAAERAKKEIAAKARRARDEAARQEREVALARIKQQSAPAAKTETPAAKDDDTATPAPAETTKEPVAEEPKPQQTVKEAEPAAAVEEKAAVVEPAAKPKKEPAAAVEEKAAVVEPAAKPKKEPAAKEPEPEKTIEEKKPAAEKVEKQPEESGE